MIVGFIPVMFEIYVLKRGSDVTLFSSAFAFVTPITFGISMLFTISNHTRKEVLRGIIGGSICFNQDEITVNDHKYLLSELRKINIYMNDYEGRLDSNYKTFNGRISRGVSNSVILYLNNGIQKTFYFQQSGKHDNKLIHEELIHYYLMGKLHWLNLIDVLGISDYDEIQRFKSILKDRSS